LLVYQTLLANAGYLPDEGSFPALSDNDAFRLKKEKVVGNNAVAEPTRIRNGSNHQRLFFQRLQDASPCEKTQTHVSLAGQKSPWMIRLPQSATTSLSHKIAETHLSWFFALEQGINLFTNHNKTLRIIRRQTVLANQMLSSV